MLTISPRTSQREGWTINTKANVNDPDHDGTVDDVTAFVRSLGVMTIPYGIERWREYLDKHDGFFGSWDWLAKFERSRPDNLAWCPDSQFGFYYDGKTGAVYSGEFNIEAIPLARAQVIGIPTLFVHREVREDGTVIHEGGLFAGVWPCGWNTVTVHRLNYPGDSKDRSGDAAVRFFNRLRPQAIREGVKVAGSGDPYCRLPTTDLVDDWKYELRTQMNMARGMI